MTDTLNSPLLGDGVAEKYEKEVEDDGPDDDDSTNTIDPDPQLVSEDPHVEGKLAHFES